LILIVFLQYNHLVSLKFSIFYAHDITLS
jgi:hypothetical protein